jgi:hypothetical protein
MPNVDTVGEYHKVSKFDLQIGQSRSNTLPPFYAICSIRQRYQQSGWCQHVCCSKQMKPMSSICPVERRAQALEISARTVIRIKQRFVQQGLQAALAGNYPKERPLRRKVDGRVEAHLIATACGAAPLGHRRWTMQLLADRVVDLGFVDQISDETVRLALKKTVGAILTSC